METYLSRSQLGLLEFALKLAIGCIIVAFFYVARSVLIPLTLAILFSLLLSGPMAYLQRRGIPKVLAATLVVIMALVLLGGLGWLMSAQMTSLASQLPAYRERIARRLITLRDQSTNSLPGRVYRFINQMNEDMVKRQEESAPRDPSNTEGDIQLVKVVEPESTFDPSSFLELFAVSVEPLTATGLVVLFLIFFLIEREEMRNRLITLIGHGHLTVTTKAIDEATTRTIRYLRAQFMINVGYGSVVAIFLFFLGIPYAMVWGFFAFCFRYVPLVGPWIAMVFPLLMSFIASEGWLQPLGVIGLFICCELVANLIFDPWLFGRSVGMSQTALVVALAFWTWLWGAPGLVMAAPLTVCLLVMGKYIPQLKVMALLLGEEPAVPCDIHFYQRLLAHDLDEASNLAKEHLKTNSLLATADEIYVRALYAAKRDQAAGRLNDHDAQFIAQGAQETFEANAPLTVKREEEEEGQDENKEPLATTPTVLVYAARDEFDDAALSIFLTATAEQVPGMQAARSQRLVSEIVSLIETQQPRVLLFIALPPSSLTFIRLVCKRLRVRFPELGLVVGRWGLPKEGEEELTQIIDNGASYCSVTMTQSLQQVMHLLQFQKSSAAAATSLPNPVRATA